LTCAASVASYSPHGRDALHLIALFLPLFDAVAPSGVLGFCVWPVVDFLVAFFSSVIAGAGVSSSLCTSESCCAGGSFALLLLAAVHTSVIFVGSTFKPLCRFTRWFTVSSSLLSLLSAILGFVVSLIEPETAAALGLEVAIVVIVYTAQIVALALLCVFTISALVSYGDKRRRILAEVAAVKEAEELKRSLTRLDDVVAEDALDEPLLLAEKKKPRPKLKRYFQRSSPAAAAAATSAERDDCDDDEEELHDVPPQRQPPQHILDQLAEDDDDERCVVFMGRRGI
jgi:hypothetical protein